MLPFIAHLTCYKFNYLLTVIMSAKFITSFKTLFLRNYEARTFNLGVLENTLGRQTYTYVPMAAYGTRFAISALHEKLKAVLAKRKQNYLNINLSEKCRHNILAQKNETYIRCSVHLFSLLRFSRQLNKERERTGQNCYTMLQFFFILFLYFQFHSTVGGGGEGIIGTSTEIFHSRALLRDGTPTAFIFFSKLFWTNYYTATQQRRTRRRAYVKVCVHFYS